jgi:hypothetical protein
MAFSLKLLVTDPDQAARVLLQGWADQVSWRGVMERQ